MKKDLVEAKKYKNDEFYTRYEDIEKELSHYKEQLKDKVIYCNCDDYKKSNFVKYFRDNFSKLHLKKLIATHYIKKDIFSNDKCYRYEKTIKNESITELKDDGSFMSDECISILEESDIIITNPPFSLFKDFIQLLYNKNKQFLIIGNHNIIGCKYIFPLLKNNIIKIGYGFNEMVGFFYSTYKDYATASDHKDNMIRVSGVCWITNLNVYKNNKIQLTKKYDPELYEKYDNCGAINVDKLNDIPYDYDGVMGVPITFMYKYNPEQFYILGLFNINIKTEKSEIPITRLYNDFKEMRQDGTFTGCSGSKANGIPVLKGKSKKGNFLYNPVTNEYVHAIYARILIKRK